MKSIILYTLDLVSLSLALSCNIVDLELSLKMGMKATSRTVPVNTPVTFNCSTSNCVHVGMYITTLEKMETMLDCDTIITIDMNGVLICRNITITEPVKVRCVGTHSNESCSSGLCHSWGSILIGIEESTTTLPCTCITENLPCNCSSSTKPTSQENEAAKCADANVGLISATALMGVLNLVIVIMLTVFIILCCYRKRLRWCNRAMHTLCV